MRARFGMSSVGIEILQKKSELLVGFFDGANAPGNKKCAQQRFSRTGIAFFGSEKNVGRIGVRGNYYDTDFFPFRTRIIGSLKNATWRLGALD